MARTMHPAPSAPSRPLRYRLFLLAASGLVPLALVLLFAAAYMAQERRASTQQSAIDLSRALSTAVDTELRSSIALLQTLAATAQMEGMAPAQLKEPTFIALARRMAQGQGWQQITVSDVSGNILARTTDGPLQPARAVEPDSISLVAQRRTPVVGSLARGPKGREAFAVRVPVMRGEQVIYVLSAVVPSARVLDVIGSQKIDPSWVVGVFDQAGFRVARTRASPEPRYSPSLEQLVSAHGNEGGGMTRTLEGVQSHTGFSRVRTSQWVVAVGIPAAGANVDVYGLLGALGAGTAASLGLLAWIAWRVARYITGPIDQLKQAAAHLGAGRQVQLPPLGVEELDDLGSALQRAANDRDEANQRRARVEAEREELLARVERALGAAEQANRNKDEFMALLGHELRNPLAPIANAVHLLELKGDPGTLRERGVIQRQLSYVTRLVDDLLDAARINSGRLVMNLQPVQPVHVLEQTLDAVRPSAKGRQLLAEIDRSSRDLWVRADEARLVQIFNNLLGNAIKFTGEGGIIGASARRHGDSIEFTIRDDGAGMSAQQLARAFDIFWQAPNSQRSVNGGLGLGLAIVKSLVEMHSGRVWASSGGPGQGTAVTLSLPIIEAVDESAAEPRESMRADAVRVLVVDDNEDAALTLAAMLEVSGYTVRAVFTPEEGIALFDEFAPQLGVLDIGLPGMDGYELVGRLRDKCGDRRCKFVALTGYGQESDIKKALAAGFDAHLTKPAEPEMLLRLLAQLASAPA